MAILPIPFGTHGWQETLNRFLKTQDSRMTAAGPLTVNVAQYGVTPDNTAAQNDDGLASLFAAHGSGVRLAFPENGTYDISATLPSRDNLGLLGAGLGTILKANTVPMFDLTASIMRGHTVQNIALHNDTLGDHIYKMGGAESAGIILSSWRDCELRTNRDDRSIHFFSAPAVPSNYFGLMFDNAKMWRNATATVPAFDFAAASPSGLNSNKFKGGWWHSLGATSTPFFRFTCSENSSYAHTWEFDGVIGEQSNGGLIHMDSASNIKVSLMLDQDAQGNYTGDLFRFTRGAGGLYCQSVDIDQSGTSGVAAFDAGKNHLLIDSGGAGHMVGRIRNGGTASPVVSVPARGVIRRTSNGFALPVASIAASQAVSTNAHRTVIATGATQTLTLPDPATVAPGTEFAFKNTSSTALTVNAAVGLVDGAASKSLAQWAGSVFVTDGTDWFAI